MTTNNKILLLGLVGPCILSQPAIAQADFLNPSDLTPRKSPIPDFPALPESDFLLEKPPLIEQPPPNFLQDSVEVESFIFKGNTVYRDEDLQKIAAPYFEGPQTIIDLQELTQKIVAFYENAGYVAVSAALAQQQNSKVDPEKAIVTILITEGTLEAIDIVGAGRTEKYVRQRLPDPNSIINEDTILEDIRLLQADQLVEKISVNLTKGSFRDRYVLNVEVEPAKQRSLVLALDNDRSPTVGSFQRSIKFTDRNLLGLGDSLSFRYGNTDGSNSIQGEYAIPINSQNGVIGLKYFYGSSNIVEDPFRVLDIEVDAELWELSFRQPIARKATSNSVEEFALGLSFTRESSDFSLLGIPFPVSRGADELGRTRTSVLRFSQDWSKQSNSTLIFLRSQFNVGLDILGATTDDDGPDGRFFAWKAQGLVVKRLFDDWTIALRSELQLAESTLVPSEQFTLGGFSSVRGYRQNLLLGDNGWLSSIELGIPIYSGAVGNFRLTPFFEAGTIWNNEPQFIPSANTLAAVGLGLRYQREDCPSVRLDWGIPLLNTPEQRSSLQESGVYFSIQCDLF